MNLKRISPVVPTIATFILINACTQNLSPSTVTLNISAGAGLKPEMEQIKQIYQQKQPNVNLTFNFAGSGILQMVT